MAELAELAHAKGVPIVLIIHSGAYWANVAEKNLSFWYEAQTTVPRDLTDEEIAHALNTEITWKVGTESHVANHIKIADGALATVIKAAGHKPIYVNRLLKTIYQIMRHENIDEGSEELVSQAMRQLDIDAFNDPTLFAMKEYGLNMLEMDGRLEEFLQAFNIAPSLHINEQYGQELRVSIENFTPELLEYCIGLGLVRVEGNEVTLDGLLQQGCVLNQLYDRYKKAHPNEEY